MSERSADFIPSDAREFVGSILSHKPPSLWRATGPIPPSVIPMLAHSIEMMLARERHVLVLASSGFARRCQEVLRLSSAPAIQKLDAATLIEIEANILRYWESPRAVVVDVSDLHHELVLDALGTVKWGIVLLLDFIGDEHRLVERHLAKLYADGGGVAIVEFGATHSTQLGKGLVFETKRFEGIDDDAPALPERAVYKSSALERAYFADLKAAIDEVKDETFRQHFMSMATSSVYALEQRLLYEITSAKVQSNRKLPFRLEIPEASDADKFRVDLQMARPYFQWNDPHGAEILFTKLLQAADRLSDEPKLLTLSSVIQQDLENGKNICMYTSFDETATFLRLACCDRNWVNTIAIRTSDPEDEIFHKISSFRDRGGLLVAASGTTVGYALGEVDIIVSYDHPLSRREMSYRASSLRPKVGGNGNSFALINDDAN